jgi:hypothetical protein
VFFCALAPAFFASAMDYVFPANAKVFDITKSPYSADNTGATDVSAILTKAANDIIASPSWNPGILYFPNGTYLVKNTFGWRLNSSGNGVGPHLIGQSRTGTVIKLAKGTWPLGTETKAVIQTGAGVEQNFSKGIINLTVLVDSNNAGAIGIIYVSNNNGLLSDVDVISADGKGMYGILSGWYSGSPVGGNGPLIIRRTYIKGFKVGIRAGGSQSEMASQIRLEGQSQYGIWVGCDNFTIDSLTTNDTCVAVQAEAPVLLTHGLLTGGLSKNYAIRNFQSSSYFNDITTSGYRAAIQSTGTNPAPTTASFAEYSPVGSVSLFPSAKTSMNLPTKYPPEIPWETDFTKWAFPSDYKTGGLTDVQALQAAIDDPAKTVVCLPHGTVLQIDQPVYVRGTISRIFGTGGTFSKVGTNGGLYIDDGSAPIVMIQKAAMQFVSGEPSNCIPIVKRTSRTVVLETIGMLDFKVLAGGEMYATDITSAKNAVDHSQARVWLWQWEGWCCGDSTLTVRNGIVRSVGYYDEGWGSMLFCLGGFTEVLGYWDYSGCQNKTNMRLLTVGGDANVSAAGIWQQQFCNPWAGYTRLISETRNGTTKILGNASGAGDVVSPAGGNIALYTAYDSAAVQNAILDGVQLPGPVAADKDVFRLRAIRSPGGIEVIYSINTLEPVTLLAYSASGRIIGVFKEPSQSPGIHRSVIARSGFHAGIACIELRAGGKAMRSLVMPF